MYTIIHRHEPQDTYSTPITHVCRPPQGAVHLGARSRHGQYPEHLFGCPEHLYNSQGFLLTPRNQRITAFDQAHNVYDIVVRHHRQRAFQVLFSCAEGLLYTLNVRNLVLPARRRYVLHLGARSRHGQYPPSR
jgi:hypothetical protein